MFKVLLLKDGNKAQHGIEVKFKIEIKFKVKQKKIWDGNKAKSKIKSD